MLKIIASGNLGKDAEKKVINGKEALVFTLAINYPYKGETRTLWASCLSYQPYLLPHLKKGKSIQVIGNFEIQTYLNAKKETQISISIVCQIIEPLPSCNDKNNNSPTLFDEPF